MSSQRDYKKMYKQLKTENIKLKQTIEIMTQEVMEHMHSAGQNVSYTLCV